MVRSIKYPKYKIRELPGNQYPYTLYWKIPILPIYLPMENRQTLQEAIKQKQRYIEKDEELKQKKIKMKQKRWVTDEEQFAEIL